MGAPMPGLGVKRKHPFGEPNKVEGKGPAVGAKPVVMSKADFMKKSKG